VGIKVASVTLAKNLQIGIRQNAILQFVNQRARAAKILLAKKYGMNIRKQRGREWLKKD